MRCRVVGVERKKQVVRRLPIDRHTDRIVLGLEGILPGPEVQLIARSGIIDERPVLVCRPVFDIVEPIARPIHLTAFVEPANRVIDRRGHRVRRRKLQDKLPVGALTLVIRDFVIDRPDTPQIQVRIPGRIDGARIYRCAGSDERTRSAPCTLSPDPLNTELSIGIGKRGQHAEFAVGKGVADHARKLRGHIVTVDHAGIGHRRSACMSDKAIVIERFGRLDVDRRTDTA